MFVLATSTFLQVPVQVPVRYPKIVLKYRSSSSTSTSTRLVNVSANRDHLKVVMRRVLASDRGCQICRRFAGVVSAAGGGHAVAACPNAFFASPPTLTSDVSSETRCRSDSTMHSAFSTHSTITLSSGLPVSSHDRIP